MSRTDEIYHFWFQGINDQTPVKNSELPFRMWFKKDEGVDRQIRERFEADLLRASEGKYADWEATARGRLALVLLFDQFSRNMYRGNERSFAFDERALESSVAAIDKGFDKEMRLIERVFLYMPLQHSEDIRRQERSVACFQLLLDESQVVNPANTPYYKYTLDYARRHYEIIKRFGRFPHRNVILKRNSSQEESAFLTQPDSRF